MKLTNTLWALSSCNGNVVYFFFYLLYLPFIRLHFFNSHSFGLSFYGTFKCNLQDFLPWLLPVNSCFIFSIDWFNDPIFPLGVTAYYPALQSHCLDFWLTYISLNRLLTQLRSPYELLLKLTSVKLGRQLIILTGTHLQTVYWIALELWPSTSTLTGVRFGGILHKECYQTTQYLLPIFQNPTNWWSDWCLSFLKLNSTNDWLPWPHKVWTDFCKTACN